MGSVGRATRVDPAPSPSSVRRTTRKALDFARAHFTLLAVLVAAAVLRLIFLNYSEFQGDEVKALYPSGAEFPLWLLAQRKGPGQFLVTLMVRLTTTGYGEWQTRLPFAVASVVTVLVVFLLVRDSFGRRPALWAAALVATCGLVVAFGRIVQYQALVMLAVSLAAWLLIRWVKFARAGYLYAAVVSYALGVLAHYDALTFAPAFLALIGLGFMQPEIRTRRNVLHAVAAAFIGGLIVAAFYVPFVLAPDFRGVARYLGGRVVAGLGWGTFLETRRLLRLYLPPLYLPGMAVLGLIGAVVALARRSRPFGPIILLWFVVPFGFYMLLGGQPRSHVYMYILPGLILAGVGTEAVVHSVRSSRWRPVARAAAWAGVALCGFLAYFLVVDHTIEHPWEPKSLLGYEFPNLATAKVEGVFGFPYRRGLAQVGDLFQSGYLQGTFDSNERYTSTEYYFGGTRSSPPGIYYDEPGSSAPDYYVYVLRPFSLQRDLPDVVRETYRPVGSISQGGRTTIEIFAAPWIRAGPQTAP